MAVGGERQMTFLLAGPEKRLLVAMAARLPSWVNSDHLTALGVIGALGTGAAYYLTNLHGAWLWVASAMLIVNWFGDSLDGTLARVRNVERPRFGFYLDHAVDAFATAVVGAGVGLSPFVDFDMSLLLVIAYLMLSINVYLEAQVFKVFKPSYGMLGPTEARLLLIVANTVLAVSLTAGAVTPVSIEAVANLVVGGVAAIMVLLVLFRFATNLARLYREEPLKK